MNKRRLQTWSQVFTSLAYLQTQLKAQNSKIQQLFQKVAQQQRYLSKQNLRIQNLQSQVITPGIGPNRKEETQNGGISSGEMWLSSCYGVSQKI